MKFLMTVAAAAFAAAVFADEPAAPGAKRHERPGRPAMGERARMGGEPLVWAVMNPKVAEKIGLSEEQKAKIKALKAPRGANRALNEKVRQGMDRQIELLKADKIDEAAVMAAIDEVFEARKEMAKDQTRRLIAVRTILTPEQVVKAREAMQELRRGPRGGHGPREGRGPRPEGGVRPGPEGDRPCPPCDNPAEPQPEA